MAGAKQWKAPCPHIDDRPADVCMHSEVSHGNASHWEAIRLPDGVDARDLRAALEYAGDETLAVCNGCRRINVINAGGVDVLHSGDPHYNDRVGEWLVDIHSDPENQFAGGSR